MSNSKPAVHKTLSNTSQIFGGGMMGDVIRGNDWGTTSLGPMSTWSQRLLGILNTIIESKFPQFLFWGKESYSFYNDSYASSLGIHYDHKMMIGAPGPEFWGDVWDQVAGPLVASIKDGNPAAWYEDQLVPIERNNRLEDVYWTFSYSPVRCADGKIEGVLVTVMETTEKVIAFKNLEESRNELHFAVDAAALASFEWKPLENKFSGNETMRYWFGLKNSEDLDIELAISTIKKEDQPRVRAAIADAMNPDTSPNYDIIYTIEAGNLKPRIVRAIGKIYFNKNRKPERFNGVILDITKQHASEREQRQLLALVDTSSEFILLTDRKGKITTANPTATNFLDIKDCDDENIIDFVYPEDQNLARDLLASLKEQDSFLSELRFWNCKSEEIFWILCNTSVIRDPSSDDIIALAITGSNITIQKEKELLLQQTNESLRESENRFKHLSNNAPAFIIMSDLKGNITFANRLLTKYLGMSNEDLIGKALFDFMHLDDIEACKTAYNDASKKDSEYKIEFRARGKDGLYRWVSNIGVPRFDGNGAFEGYTHAALIIQELKLQEQQKDLFIGMASHELKTPVTSIKGYIQLLKMKYAKSEDPFLVKTLRVVDSQILVLTSLITDLLDLSKMKSGGLKLNTSTFDFSAFIKEIIEQQEMINIEHSYNYANNVDIIVQADKDRLGQVLINFLSNAVKYAPNSKTIDVFTTVENNVLSVSVKDYGIGINSSNQEKVFERFFREEGTDEKTFPGFGIGLFIAADIIKKHKGTIGVQSAKGEGSTFYFTIPIKNL